MAKIEHEQKGEVPREPGLLGRAMESIKEGWENLHVGEGSLAAAGRLGLKELRNAFNPSRESVAGDEIGMYGTATQGEIAKARKGPGEGPEQESMGDLRAAAQEKARGQEPHHGLPEAAKEQERGGMEM